VSIAYTESFLLETLGAIHDFASDDIKMALFDGGASFDRDTTVYTTTNELTDGGGYTTGGESLTLVSGYPRMEADGAAVRYENQEWALTSSKTIKWALIYNATKGNRAIMSINMGEPFAALGTFSFNFPLSVNPPIWNKAPL
jgi:hypothetical protein